MTEPRFITLNGTAHPRARIDRVDAGAGVCLFTFVDAQNQPLDSGGSIARFTPADPLPADPEQPDAEPQYPEIADATLAGAIANPPAPVGPTVFDYTQFVAHCDARVPGFTARVLTAARTSTEIQNWVNIAVSRNAVHLDSPDFAAAFVSFISAGLMTTGERDAILAP